MFFYLYLELFEPPLRIENKVFVAIFVIAIFVIGIYDIGIYVIGIFVGLYDIGRKDFFIVQNFKQEIILPLVNGIIQRDPDSRDANLSILCRR